MDKEDAKTQELMGSYWRNDKTITELERLSRNTYLQDGKVQRDYLKDYYNSPVGKESWQNSMI